MMCASLGYIEAHMLSFMTQLISWMDPLKYLFEKPPLSTQIAKWQPLLAEFDIICVTWKAIKGQNITNH